MSPISREREYARRRYQKWQDKLAVKQAKRRRQRRITLIAAGATAVVLVVAVALLVLKGSGDDTTAAQTAPTTAASASSAATSSAGPNPCPAPTVKPAAKPEQFSAAPSPELAQGKTWKLTLVTTCGTVVAELDGAKAPKAVANAIFLSGKKFWDGSPCHRLGAAGLYMLQCGDPTGTGTGGPGYSFGPVENPPANGLFKAGVLAMARASSEDSQGSQFFLVFRDTQLDGRYTVFGRITQGLDVVQKVAAGGVSTPGADGSGPPARAISIVQTSVTPA